MAGRVEDVEMSVPAGASAAFGPRERRESEVVRTFRSARVATELARPGPSESSSDGPTFEQVFEALRRWRLDQARERAVAPFIVMHDRTLEAIATSLPQSLDELSDVPGIGPTKLSLYGDAILSVIASAVTAAAG